MNNNLKEIKVWQKSVELSTEIYNLTNAYLGDEKFGIISQLRRSSVSIPSNIAEGAGRNSPKEFIRFLNIAKGSSLELHTQLIISKNIHYITEKQLIKLEKDIDEIQRMIYGFIEKLKTQAL